MLALLVMTLTLASCSSTDIELTPITTAPTGQHQPGRLVWHDLLTNDIETARKFYAGLFGWTYQNHGKYTVISNNGVPIGGMAEVEFKPDVSPYWVPYLSVADVEQAVATATAAGGEVLKGPGTMIGRGRYALIGDAQGARVVLLHSSTGDPARKPAELNGWLWNELWSTDPAQALAFYQKLVPYQTLSTDGDNAYHVLTIDGRWTAGLTSTPFTNMNSQWVPAVQIGELQTLATQVDKLGGRILIEPDHALADGVVALIQDPTGALLMVETSSPDDAGPSAPGQVQ